jgi:hypothetical protein
MITLVLRFTDPEFIRASGPQFKDGLAALVDVFLDGVRPRADRD